MTFALMRLEGLKKSSYYKKSVKNEASFYFQSLKIQDTGHYLCLYYDASYRGSLFSDILKVWVTGKTGVCYGSCHKLYLIPSTPLYLVIWSGLMGGQNFFNLVVNLKSANWKTEEENSPKYWKEGKVLILAIFILGLILDTFPKTWLLVQPSPVIQMGQNVSLKCEGLMDGVGLALYKEGEERPLQFLDGTSNNGNKSFLLKNVTNKDAGIYSCQYFLDWKTSIKMETYNTVELIVVGK